MLIHSDDPNRKEKEVLALYKIVFGNTEIIERVYDILDEAKELVSFTSEENLREEAGDVLASLYALCAEKGWSVDALVKENLTKVKHRFNTGYYDNGKKVN